MDETQAIRRLKRGDISGLKALVERYQVKAARTAYLITRDLAAADDVMQAAFLRAYKSIGGFDDKRPFEPWLMRIVINLALKSVQYAPETLDDEVIEETLPDGEATDPEWVIEEGDLTAMVREALDQLPPKQRAVIVLYYYLDYTESDIAAALERPLGTVRWQLQTAKKLLKALLKKGVDS